MNLAAIVFTSLLAPTQNLVPINPSAETGMDGWIGQTVEFGAARPPDPLNSIGVTADPNLVSDGSYSFWLHDGSANTSVELLSSTSPSNRVQINRGTRYQFTFDIKLVPDTAAPPVNPLLQLRYWTSSTGGSMILQDAFNLLNSSEFDSATPVGNGFTRYAVEQFIPRNPPPQQSPPLYCELNFFTDFYANSRSDLYVDNIVAAVVPEPGSLLLAAFAGCMCMMSHTRRRRSEL